MDEAMLDRIRPAIERCATARFAELRRDRRASTLTVHDLVQSIVLHLCATPAGTIGRYDPAIADLEAHVYSIARNVARDAIRAELRHTSRTTEDIDDQNLAAPDAPSDPVAEVHARRVLAHFRAECSALELEMFEELFVLDKTAAEIAPGRGWANANTPNLWRHRIRARLQAISRRLQKA